MIQDFYFPQYVRYLMGEEVSFVGLPNNWGRAGSRAILSGTTLGMSSACKYKEGAWAFLRTRLLPRYQEGERIQYASSFPINRSDFELLARQQMTPEYITKPDGSIATDSNGDKMEQEIFAAYEQLPGLRYRTATQADYDQIMALYDAIEPSGGVDGGELLSLVRELAGAYFAGDKSLEETMGLIQNRAMLYVNEQQ